MKTLTGLEAASDIRIALLDHGSVVLNTSALRVMLEAFNLGRLDAKSVEQIADELERDSVVYETGKEVLIASILFDLSSPEINGKLTSERCTQILATLKNANA